MLLVDKGTNIGEGDLATKVTLSSKLPLCATSASVRLGNAGRECGTCIRVNANRVARGIVYCLRTLIGVCIQKLSHPLAFPVCHESRPK